MNPSEKDSTGYRQIFRSTSIVGGTQGIGYIIGMLRTKGIAILLGPEGVGLISMYSSITGTIGTLSMMGIGESAVREVAVAHGTGDPVMIARTVHILRRACWVVGLVGCVVTVILAPTLSVRILGSKDHALAIAALGVTVIFGAISCGQSALLQGSRRIAELAKVNLTGSMASVLPILAIYYWLGMKGVVPALIATSAITLLFNWYYARRVSIVHVPLSFAETWTGSRGLVTLGLAFMWSAVLWAGRDLGLRTLVTRQLGMEANGIYQAAWAVSGLFANFILRAMGTDFFPRLTAQSLDHPAMCRTINEQVEIGTLLALPGVIATISFAPWMMSLLYSDKFLSGAELLNWFSVGVFLRVISFPLSYIQMAKGEYKSYIWTNTAFILGDLLVSTACIYWLGIKGVAMASAALYLIYTVAISILGKKMIGFHYSIAAQKMLGPVTALVTMSLVLSSWIGGNLSIILGIVLLTLSGIFSLRGLAIRLGADHRIIRLVCILPGGKAICGLNGTLML